MSVVTWNTLTVGTWLGREHFTLALFEKLIPPPSKKKKFFWVPINQIYSFDFKQKTNKSWGVIDFKNINFNWIELIFQIYDIQLKMVGELTIQNVVAKIRILVLSYHVLKKEQTKKLHLWSLGNCWIIFVFNEPRCKREICLLWLHLFEVITLRWLGNQTFVLHGI